MLTFHVFDEEIALISDIAHKKLSPEQQKIVFDTCTDARKWAAERAYTEEQKYLEQFKEAGVTIVNPDIASFQKATAGVVKGLTEDLAPGLDAVIVALK
jgi:TRAP-type C4-dicarboxylate transport system substrate-binding protein